MNPKTKRQGVVFLLFTLEHGFKRVCLQAPKTPPGRSDQTCKTSAFLDKNLQPCEQGLNVAALHLVICSNS